MKNYLGKDAGVVVLFPSVATVVGRDVGWGTSLHTPL